MIKRLYTAVRADSWKSLTYCDVLLVCSDADRGYVFQGKRYAQLIDSLGDLFNRDGLSTRTIAYRFSQYIGKKGYGEPASLNRARLRFALGSRLISLFRGRFAGERWRDTRETRLWKTILTKCQPKAVIGIQPATGLCRAGHELGVKVYDLQHGVISDTEDNQYYWSKNLARKESADLPHGFLCWDKSSAEVLLPIAIKKGIIVRVIGNPWFTRFITPDARDVLVQEEKSRCADIDHGLPIILVTLQYNLAEYAHDYVQNGVMAGCLEETIRETCSNYHWCLRLHPLQVNGIDPINVQEYLQMQFGKFKNIDWRITSRAALPALLSRADLHITHYSATTIEAAWMGMHTGLLDPHIRPGGKHAGFFTNERALHLAQPLPLEVPAIKHFIKSALRNGKSEIPEQDYNNLNSFVEEIKSGSVYSNRSDTL